MGKLHVKWPNSLNVDLVRASPMMIDYVICHELAHAFYPTRWLPPLSSARKSNTLAGRDQWFESGFLQLGVNNEP